MVVEIGTSERKGAEGERTWFGGEKGRIVEGCKTSGEAADA